LGEVGEKKLKKKGEGTEVHHQLDERNPIWSLGDLNDQNGGERKAVKGSKLVVRGQQNGRGGGKRKDKTTGGGVGQHPFELGGIRMQGVRCRSGKKQERGRKKKGGFGPFIR